ncbi:MAG: hypothetical protein ABIH72_00160 [archaeon]
MFEKEDKRKLIILASVILVLLVVAVYFTFLYYKKCNDIECFNSYLRKCSKAGFQHDSESAVWYYKIKGVDSGECVVSVELIQAKEGNIDLLPAEGKSMDCYLPKGVVVEPHKSISRCHGLLKEETQQIIIDRMITYILDNVGEISEELQKTL